MAKVYVVLGAGMQGVAAAYDFGLYGEAKKVILADANEDIADARAERLNKLLNRTLVFPEVIDVENKQGMSELLKKADVCLSAVPYYYNVGLTQIAINANCHFCDLGGNTDVVIKQHDMHLAAKEVGVTIAPDCGLAPGMANILAAHGIRNVPQPKGAYIRVGGLPQFPKPPLGYSLSFNIEGLTNEYFGKAVVLRKGKVTYVDTFTELEEIEFPAPFGKCEAFMTAGGTSTCPFTFEGQIEEFDEKTIRYPGHYEKMKTIHELGFLDLNPVEIEGQRVAPRNVFHAVVGPKLMAKDVRDVVLLRVTVRGKKETMVMELIDRFDVATGLTAMQRTTGFGAAIVGIMMGQGDLPSGCINIEKDVDSDAYIKAMRERGFDLKIS